MTTGDMTNLMRCMVLTICLCTMAACEEPGNPAVGQSPPSATPTLTAQEIEDSLVAAQRYFDGGEFTRAQAILEEIVARAPGEILAQELLARSIYHRGALEDQAGRRKQAETLYAEAYEQYVLVVALEPQNAGWHQNAGDFALMAKRSDNALAHYEEAQRLDPTNPRHPLMRAQLLLQAGRTESAEEAVERVLAIDPESAHAMATLAAIAMERGETDEAIERARAARALARDEEAIHFRVMEARFHRMAGNPEESVLLLMPLSEEERADLGVATETALAYTAMGEYERVIAVWAHRFRHAHDGLAALKAAQAAIAADLPDAAQQWLDVARESLGDDPAIAEVQAMIADVDSP